MNATTEATTKVAVDPSTSKPTSAEARIHWAAPVPKKIDPVADAAQARTIALEEKFEAMRARNWITEQMVSQYQKHWKCTREAALERLFAKAGA